MPNLQFKYLKLIKHRLFVISLIFSVIVFIFGVNIVFSSKSKDIKCDYSSLTSSDIDNKSRTISFQNKSINSKTEKILEEKKAAAPKTVTITLENFGTLKKTAQVNVNKYAKEEISNNIIFPYENAVNTDVKTYDFKNMVSGYPVPELKNLQTPENLNSLAKIIHCEMCAGGNYEAALAVGTVVVNRVYNDQFPNTIDGVISAPGQFSPYSNGRYFTCTPCDECLKAAYEILYNNYRSFPFYVYYFQSIEKNYFSETLPYVSFQENGYLMFFSYNPKDID